MCEVNEALAIEAAKAAAREDDDDTPKSGTKPGSDRKRKTSSKEDPKQGVLLLDAKCEPADVAYPTDLNLLSEFLRSWKNRRHTA